ncbi:DUF3343 domain-containing protein [Caloramator proteoclasticus]|uniref:Putative Se/S carrier protein-like domain-containing protein n=1 Tax=Caloramator proteoclasticus DSM 10124 TaxID=1121262 RepID=A0A1M4VJQ7_9CLOT|nr:DUF3343 domain-containing protein [Caloramator proteoclasticus]SHE69209.1 Protein of unknown function [Caloramator proteoclasticus DSM 10124]
MYIVTFHTQSAAFMYKRLLEQNGITVELMPTPRRISSSCGIAARVFDEEALKFRIDELDSIYNEELKLIIKNT